MLVISNQFKNKKFLPSKKGFCIGDVSSSEDEGENKQNYKFEDSGPTIIGGDEPNLSKSSKPKIPTQIQENIVIGDESSDEENKNEPFQPTTGSRDIEIENSDEEEQVKPKIAQPITSTEINDEYRDKLSQIYATKKIRNEEIFKEKEKHLKKFEEEKKTKRFNKLADSDDEEEIDENVDQEELWKKFVHKNIEKPVMKVSVRSCKD